MKIGLRAGHSPNCRGAIGIKDEWESMNILYGYVKDILISNGHTVIDCNSKAYAPEDELAEGANKANGGEVDLFISLHMNSFNGQAHGVEALTQGETSRANTIAKRLCENYAKLGFFNRGVKYQPNFYEMRRVNAPNIIFETCFCDSQKDIDIWSPTPWGKLAAYICNAIDPNISLNAEEVKPVEAKKDRYQIRIYAFTSKQDADKASKKIKDQFGYYNVVEKM